MCAIKRFIIITIIPLFAAAAVAAEEIPAGDMYGWQLFEIHRNTTMHSVRGGYDEISLSDSAYSPDGRTEMLLHFDNDCSDSSGVYTLKKNSGVDVNSYGSLRGQGAAVFPGDNEYLEYIPDVSAAFAAGSGRIADFTIEFWLNPSRLSEGEDILQWTGALKTPDGLLQQEILCGVSARNLFWEFRNFFLGPDMSSEVFRLDSSRALIPKRWHHHMVRYKSDTGLLEYLIDGVPEKIIYVSRDRNESSEIYYPLAGAAKPAKFIIGKGFTGFLDELRITNSFETRPRLSRYELNSGTAVSGIIDLQYYDSRFKGIEVREKKPGQTQIYYYYRLLNRYFNPYSELPSWTQFNPGELLDPSVKGRYLQIMVELFPDGTLTRAPVLSSLVVSYDKNLPPMAPGAVSAEAGNGSVTLSWQPVTDADVAGYRIYFGDRPGSYFGTGSSAGDSPIDAGSDSSMKLEGLENGKLYYFAITSYDNAEIPHESVFSREITARPAAIIRDGE